MLSGENLRVFVAFFLKGGREGGKKRVLLAVGRSVCVSLSLKRAFGARRLNKRKKENGGRDGGRIIINKGIYL